MRIQHNIMAMNSYRNYSSNTSALSKNLEKLSSGYKINRAGDDAAGLAISEKMRAQVSGLQQATSNAKSGINLVQTAEGSLTEVHDMLNRMVTLADQSANGTYDNETDRANIQKEVSQLTSEIDRIADSSNFNGIKLLDGSLGTGTTGATASVAAQTAGASASGITAFNYTLSGTDAGVSVAWASTVTASPALGSLSASWSGNTLTFSIGLGSGTSGTATLTQADVDAAIKNASGAPDSGSGIKVTLDKSFTVTQASSTATALTAMAGATAGEASLATAIGQTVTNTDGASTKVTVTATKAGANTHTLTVTNNAAGESEGATAIADGNVSLNLDATSSYTASEINQMLSKAGAEMTVSYDGSLTGAALLAADANGDGTFTLGTDGTAGSGLSSGGGLVLQIGDTADSFNQLTVSVSDMHTKALGIGSIDISTQSGAQAAVDKIKSAINSVSSTRGNLGALQNRLDHTINNLGVMTENIQDAESTVRDTDVASEMMDYTKNNILVQSAQAMLAQANQVPQGVLQLLQ